MGKQPSTWFPPASRVLSRTTLSTTARTAGFGGRSVPLLPSLGFLGTSLLPSPWEARWLSPCPPNPPPPVSPLDWVDLLMHLQGVSLQVSGNLISRWSSVVWPLCADSVPQPLGLAGARCFQKGVYISYFILITALCAMCCVTIPVSLRKPLGIGKFRKLRKVTFWFQAELRF